MQELMTPAQVVAAAGDVVLDTTQRAAVEMMLTAPVSCITGGAGVGKTTCIKEALREATAGGELVLLAASTGKAARRMTEATGKVAVTIHRLLEFDPTARGGRLRHRFKRGADLPLRADLVIVDEASMIDVELAEALFLAIGPETRIALIGDANQLPPVGAGRVFADLIESGVVPVARLTTLHRAAAASWVATQSRRILAGEVPDLEARADFRFFDLDDRQRAVDTIVDLATREAARSDSQIIVPQNTGPAGTEVLNALVQRVLTPASTAGWRVGSQDLRIGDRVIQTRNNYLLGVMNGEIGAVEAIDDDEGEMVVRFEDAARPYSKDAARDLRLAYALTCHKMQGSEVPWALVLVHSTHTRMLTRGWLYTAVTRARQGVAIVGDRTGIERAVKNANDTKRNSGLIERLLTEEA